MTIQGYYQYPTLCGETVVCVCEDDLWLVAATGGVARRLTANLGVVSDPVLSPDGAWLAFVGREEGDGEVYVMSAQGGPASRLTYLGSSMAIVGWTRDSQKIIFASDVGQFFSRVTPLFTLPREGGYPELLPYGPARSISYSSSGSVAIGRQMNDLAAWKRYRGGRTGDIWVDLEANGNFKPLFKQLKSNVAAPMWVGDRLYFLSDHEGVGNIYSCTPNGEDIQRQTHHEDYYVRHPKTDGQRIIYQAGADLYIFDPTQPQEGWGGVKLVFDFHSPRIQLNRKFVNASRYLEHYTLHPDGHSVAMTMRGKPFTMSNWEGAVIQYGQPQGVRYRLVEWLNSGKQLVMISDVNGEETLEAYSATENKLLGRFEGGDIGRALFIEISPKTDAMIISNHRYELLYIDAKQKIRVLDSSQYGRIQRVDWSGDGQWVVYHFPTSLNTAAIKLCHVESGVTYFVTPPNNLYDFEPSFDPDGKYIYFLSDREFNPVRDHHYFDWSFPVATRVYLITLQKNLPNPFIPMPNGMPENPDKPAAPPEKPPEGAKTEAEKPEEKLWQIDLEGIQERLAMFPINEARYRQLRGLPKGKVIFSSFPVEGAFDHENNGTNGAGRGVLEVYDLAERKKDFVVSGVSGFDVSRKKSHVIYRAGKDLRVIKAGEKPDNAATGFNRKSGWLMVSRASAAIMPSDEWRQMLREAWRLQRDHFWTEDMSKVDWQEIYIRYQALIDRVATRSEFSDLVWEMQGELGTSHAYEFGGDYRWGPRYQQGFLGADFVYDEALDGYRITHIVQGDHWLEQIDSPLNRLGTGIKVGDVLLAIDGQRLSHEVTPQQLLVNRAISEVELTFANGFTSPIPPAPPESEPAPLAPLSQGEGETEPSAAEAEIIPEESAEEAAATNEGMAVAPAQEVPQLKTRRVLVRTLRDEAKARYREWVEQNRRRVAEATEGRIGYLHVPDMGAQGFAEFHRYYLAESEKQGLIIDVRFNRGGNVSQLLLEKLAQRRLGYDLPRYGKPWPYPLHSVLGPLVVLANEHTSSDGDVFSHAFKMLKLGKLIGKRTWGGVIGIWPRHALVDGTTTSQPEFSSWFEDVGWGIENYGTDPDIEVEIRPQDYAKGKDPQLERAIKETLRQIKKKPPQIPDFGPKPNHSLPTLPKK